MLERKLVKNPSIYVILADILPLAAVPRALPVRVLLVSSQGFPLDGLLPDWVL